MPIYLAIAAAAAVGLLVSLYIHHKKSRGEELYCPIGGHCSEVVYSEYGETLGIQNTTYGIIFYGLIFLVYFAFSVPALSLNDALHSLIPAFDIIILGATGLAAAFSVYLVLVQALVLRKWCEWCLISTFASLTIFFLILL